MARLDDFLLTEKISKKDLDSALNNPNILIGAEFEFIMDAVDDSEYEVNYADYLNYNTDVKNFRSEYNEYEEKYEEYTIALDKHDDWETAMIKYEDGKIDHPGDEPNIFPEPSFPEIPELPEYCKDWYPNHYSDAYSGELTHINEPSKNEMGGVDAFNELLYSDTISQHDADTIKKWHITDDGSLGVNGVEVVTTPMKISEFLNMCPMMFKVIHAVGGTNNDCGLHIGVSLKNVKNLKQTLDIVKLALLTEEELIYKYFKSRKMNKYAESSKTALVTWNVGMVGNFIDIESLKKNYPKEKYMGINILHILEDDNQYIEFRYLGGANYHTKWPEIKRIIGHYCFNIAAACDPEFRKREYLLKLTRLMNKMELATLIKRREVIETTLRLIGAAKFKDIDKINKDLEMITKSIKLLETRYSVTEEELGRMGFLESQETK